MDALRERVKVWSKPTRKDWRWRHRPRHRDAVSCAVQSEKAAADLQQSMSLKVRDLDRQVRLFQSYLDQSRGEGGSSSRPGSNPLAAMALGDEDVSELFKHMQEVQRRIARIDEAEAQDANVRGASQDVRSRAPRNAEGPGRSGGGDTASCRRAHCTDPLRDAQVVPRDWGGAMRGSVTIRVPAIKARPLPSLHHKGRSRVDARGDGAQPVEEAPRSSAREGRQGARIPSDGEKVAAVPQEAYGAWPADSGSSQSMQSREDSYRPSARPDKNALRPSQLSALFLRHREWDEKRRTKASAAKAQFAASELVELQAKPNVESSRRSWESAKRAHERARSEQLAAEARAEKLRTLQRQATEERFLSHRGRLRIDVCHGGGVAKWPAEARAGQTKRSGGKAKRAKRRARKTRNARKARTPSTGAAAPSEGSAADAEPAPPAREREAQTARAITEESVDAAERGPQKIMPRPSGGQEESVDAPRPSEWDMLRDAFTVADVDHDGPPSGILGPRNAQEAEGAADPADAAARAKEGAAGKGPDEDLGVKSLPDGAVGSAPLRPAAALQPWEEYERKGPGASIFDEEASRTHCGLFRVTLPKEVSADSIERGASAESGVTLLFGRCRRDPARRLLLTVIFDRSQFDAKRAASWWRRSRARFDLLSSAGCGVQVGDAADT